MCIPENEVEINYSRSSGPGGQNVNKVSTKAQLRWNVGRSHAFNVAEKEMIRKALNNRLTAADEIIVTAAEERSQARNKELALRRLINMVELALKVEKKRIPTRPSYFAKLQRLAKKRKLSMLKKARKLVCD